MELFPSVRIPSEGFVLARELVSCWWRNAVGHGFSRPFGTIRFSPPKPRTPSWAKFRSPLRGWICKA